MSSILKSGKIDWEIYNIDPRDFWSSKVTGIMPLLDRELPEYNQYKHTKSKHACTIVNAVKDLCYNYDIHFSDDLVEDAIDYCVEHYWYVVGKWWHTNKAMQWVRSFIKTKGVEATYIRIDYKDPLFEEYKDAWYMIGCSFKGNTAYVLDYALDWYLIWKDFKPSNWWHRTSIYKDNFVWDSEYWLEYNEYKLWDLDALVNNWVYYPTFYIRTLPADMTAPTEEIKKDDERVKELTICENALSIAWKHLDEENQKKASELATYIRNLQ